MRPESRTTCHRAIPGIGLARAFTFTLLLATACYSTPTQVKPAADVDPDVARLSALIKKGTLTPVEEADFLQRLDDLILDTTHPDGLDQIDSLLKQMNYIDPIRSQRLFVLRDVLDIRMAVRQLKQLAKAEVLEDAKKEELAKPDPTKPDPTKPNPAKPDPAKPDPTKPDPTKPNPAKPDLAKPDPTKPDPTKPDPTKPDPTKPDPTKPDPTKPDPTKPDPAKKPELPVVDQDDVRRTLFHRISNTFLKRRFDEAFSDYVKMAAFLREQALPQFVEDLPRRSALDTAFGLLDQNLNIMKKKDGDTTHKFPQMPPIVVTVVNTSKMKADLTIQVLDSRKTLPPNGRITFRFAGSIRYPSYETGSRTGSWKDFPIKEAGELAMSFERILERPRWEINFANEAEIAAREVKPAGDGTAIKNDKAKPDDKSKPVNNGKEKQGEGKTEDPKEIKKPTGGTAEPKIKKTDLSRPGPGRPIAARRELPLGPTSLALVALMTTFTNPPADTFTPEQTAAAEELGIAVDKTPVGLPPDLTEDWKGTRRIFLTNKAFLDVFALYKHPGQKSISGSKADFDLTLDLIDSGSKLVTHVIEAASKASSAPDKRRVLQTYAKLAEFSKTDLDLIRALKNTKTYRGDKDAQKAAEDTLTDAEALLEAGLLNAKLIDSMIDTTSDRRPVGGDSSAMDEVGKVRKVVDLLEKEYQSTKSDLAFRVEEVSRARLQSYTPWQSGEDGRYHWCIFRYRPDGRSENLESAVMYFPDDPTYIYFIARRLYSAQQGNALVMAQGGICWGRFNLKEDPLSNQSWEWAPNETRVILPLGSPQSKQTFASPVNLPVVNRSLNEEQRMLWPSLVGLPGLVSSVHRSYLGGTTSRKSSVTTFDDAPPPPPILPTTTEPVTTPAVEAPPPPAPGV